MQRWSVEGKGRNTADGGKMPRAGAVANKDSRAIHQLKQLGDIARTDDVFTVLPPPGQLVRVAGDFSGNIFLAQPGHKFLKMRERPHPGRQAGTAMDERHRRGLTSRRHDFVALRQGQTQGLPGGPPEFIAMREGVRPDQGLRQIAAAI